jgi:hypothetical protein
MIKVKIELFYEDAGKLRDAGLAEKKGTQEFRCTECELVTP